MTVGGAADGGREHQAGVTLPDYDYRDPALDAVQGR